MNNYPKVVEQIHNEFNTAGERLLQESLAIIEKAEKVDTEKAERLNNVGFTSNPLLQKAKHIEELKRNPALMAQLVLDYKNKYPLHKFISNRDVDKICEKYNLIHGNTEQYVGFVPEKNLKEIECFSNSFSKGYKRIYVNEVTFTYKSIQTKGSEAIQKHIKDKKGLFIGKSVEAVQQYLENNFIGKGEEQYGRVNTSITKYTEMPVFDICAPKKEMISNERYSALKGLFGTTFKHVPDPVVLYPVEHGYIIVTAWGDEASDPLVVNEQMN